MSSISKAALPPIQPTVSERDKAHPLYPQYSAYRASMSNKLVQADSFNDWLGHRDRHASDDTHRAHAQYPEFQAWMSETKAGGRTCPGNRKFPENFLFWLSGGRW